MTEIELSAQIAALPESINKECYQPGLGKRRFGRQYRRAKKVGKEDRLLAIIQ